MTTDQLARSVLPFVGVEPGCVSDYARVEQLREQLEQLAGGEQPAPRPTDGRPVWELVVEDMHARDQLGRARYGVALQAHNGRDALRDAYEEALDLAVYLRQAIEERRANGGS